jgi:hypothetical protein
MATAFAAFSIRLQARLCNQPGELGHQATAIGMAGGSLVGMEIVGVAGRLADAVAAAARADGVTR